MAAKKVVQISDYRKRAVKKKAARKKGATKNLAILVNIMTKEQIAEAQKMAREWQAAH